MSRFTIVRNTKTIILWATHKENLNWFLKTALIPDALSGAVDKQITRKATSRQQYPGQSNPIAVKSYNYVRAFDPTHRNGSALAGRSIQIYAVDGTGHAEKRQFTLKGSWTDFSAWYGEQAKYNSYIYNHKGDRDTILVTP